MSTSDDGHYTRFDPTVIAGATDDFVDAGMAKRAVGNLDHLADQYAPRIIDWVLHGGQYFVIDTSITAAVDELYLLWRSTAFDIPINNDGTSYRLRTRLRIESAHATFTSTFKVVIAPIGASAPELAVAGVNVGSTTLASTTATWTALSSLLYLDDDMVARATSTIATIDTIGGAERDAIWLRAQMTVFGSINNVAAEARLSGVECCAFVPP